MNHKLAGFFSVALAMALAPSAADAQGRIFLTGHDPDFHAQSSPGARNLLNAGLRFVTNGTHNLADGNKFLWVESRISPPSGHLVGENGLIAVGLTRGTHYERANAAELPAVNFSNFTAVVIASSFGGLLTRAELDALIARSDDIRDFINAGGGLMALAECTGCGANLMGGPTPADLFGFLPVEVSSIAPSPPFTVTPFGAAPPFNLGNGDLNDPTHNSFGLIGGLEPIDLDQASQATTLAGVVFVGTGLSQISLLPVNATNTVGTTHFLTANVFNGLGNPIVGTAVTFTVMSGPNAGDTGQAVTDVNGDAFFNYVGDGGVGTDVIVASFVDTGGTVRSSNDAECLWQQVECFMLLGFHRLDYVFANGDHLLVSPVASFGVDLFNIPTLQIPNDPTLAGLQVFLQIFMNNPIEYPGDPIKMSNGMEVTLGGASTPYGIATGMQLWTRQSSAALGGVIEPRFSIDGL